MASKNDLDLRRFFRAIKKAKWLYAICLVIFLGLGIVYWYISMPQYLSYSKMLIEDSSLPSGGGGGSKAAGMASLMRSFSIGGFGSSSTTNELILMNSRKVMMTTVKDLSLNRTYIEYDGLSKHLIYKNNPVAVEASSETFENVKSPLIFDIEIDGNKADITLRKNRFSSFKKIEDATLPTSVKLPEGTFQILRTPHFNGEKKHIRVLVTSYAGAVADLNENLKIVRPSKLADGIEFKIATGNRKYGEAILNTVMNVYNDVRLKRRRSNAEEEIKFLDERIASLFTDLSDLETEISEFKEKNKLMGIEEEAGVLVENASRIKTEMVADQANILYYEQLLKMLNSKNPYDTYLPAFNEDSYPMIKDYNLLIQERKEMARSAKEGNPSYDLLTNQLAETRASIIENIENLLTASRIKAQAETGILGSAESRLLSLPGYEKDYINLLRDQKLKNELYMFLLEKRESAVLQLYSTSTLGFVIDEAYSSPKPSHTKQYIVFGICFFLALLLPTLYALFSMQTFRNKIYSPIDLASIGIEDQTAMVPPMSCLHNLRNLLIRDGRRRIYMAGDAEEGIRLLADSLRAIGRNVEIIPTPGCNDDLLVPSNIERMTGSDADIVMVAVPDSDNVADILNLVTEPDVALIMTLVSGKTDRKAFKKALNGFPADDVYAIITK